MVMHNLNRITEQISLCELAQKRLETLLHPIKPDEFLASVWPDKIYFTKQGGPLLSELIEQPELKDIESLVNMPFSGLCRANFNHIELPPKTGLSARQLVKAYELFKATIYLQGLQTEIIKSWNISLDSALGLVPGSARMGCFVSPKGKGHVWHYDPHETILVQVRGKKRWYLASDNWPKGIGLGHDRLLERDTWAKCNRDQVPKPTSYQTFDAYPGSVLFIPYGHWHTVENITDSLHLVLNVSRSYQLTGTKP